MNGTVILNDQAVSDAGESPLEVRRMRVEYKQSSIQIIPDSDMDKVYLEAITGLKHKGESCKAERVAVIGLDHAWAYLEIKKEQS